MNKHAFTLVEMIVVIAVIVSLGALILPVVTSASAKAEETLSINRIEHILSQAQQYEINSGQNALLLQRDAELGGVLHFATVAMVEDQAKRQNGSPPTGCQSGEQSTCSSYFPNSGGYCRFL